MPRSQDTLALLKEVVGDFLTDECPRMAAALAYYTVFAMPALLVLVIMLLGLAFEQGRVQTELLEQVEGLLGADGAEQVRVMVEASAQQKGQGLVPKLIGLAVLIFGATGAFVQLQSALNTAWEVEPDPNQGGVKNFIIKRVLSFGLILVIAFLLLVSLALSTALTLLSAQIAAYLPDFLSEAMLRAINTGMSLVVIGLLFATLYRFLPDAVITWRDVWVGAAFTAILFVIGKALIGLYLGNSDVASAYGAAGSLAVILVWIYYASMLLLFGAEFTQVWARRYGTRIQPEPGAVRVIKQKHTLPPGTPPLPHS